MKEREREIVSQSFFGGLIDEFEMRKAIVVNTITTLRQLLVHQTPYHIHSPLLFNLFFLFFTTYFVFSFFLSNFEYFLYCHGFEF